MGKNRHSKDKMHLTYTEMKEDWEGKKYRKEVKFSQLPFYCCALSLAPFQDAVCTAEGHVFDIFYIMPFICKYHRCPITGHPLNASELIKMNWTKNQNLQFEDPISYKVFTQYTHIVCIRTGTSGYVYAFDTVNELNKKSKFYYDLVTNQPFKISDIITIQDPKNAKNREVAQFDYLKKQLSFIPPEKLKPQMNENQTMSRIRQQIINKKRQKQAHEEEQVQKRKKLKRQLESREDVKGFIQWCIENKVYRHQRQTDYGSASLTSTKFTPNSKGIMSFRQLKESQIRDKMYSIIKKKQMKGLVQMVTNLGNFNILIHANLVPKTSENFIQLAQNGYYDNLEFHRLVKDFCLQGGDPGNGGQSIFGKAFIDQFHPKLIHNKIGILSMANSGSNSNQSQFFITLSPLQHLNNKNSVFGEILNNENILLQINEKLTSKSNKPKKSIIIEKMYCYDNPFRKVIKQLKQIYQKGIKNTKQSQQYRQKQRWIQPQNNKFQLPNVQYLQNLQKKQKTNLSSKLLSEYY